MEPLAQVIEGAKKEGTVSVKLTTNYGSPALIKRITRDIKERYGVDIDIKMSPTTGMAKMIRFLRKGGSS